MTHCTVKPAFLVRHLLVAAWCAIAAAACGGGYGGGGSSGGGGCGNYSSCTPTVAISAPAASASVSGMVTLSATATAKGTYTVASVQFKVDGTAVGTAVMTSPYSFDWDSTSTANGAHLITAVVTDSASQTATSAAVSVTVANGAFALTLAPDQLFPLPTTNATGTGSLSFDMSNGQGSGSITLSGMSATAVEVGDAYAGSSGAPIHTLIMNAGDANQWDVSNLTLSAQQRTDMQAGKLYVVARSAAFPGGELRAQLVPAGFTVNFAPLVGAAEVPAVSSGGRGLAAITVDTAHMKAAVHVMVAGLNPNGAEVDLGTAGTLGATLATLTVDPMNSHHYANEAVTLAAGDLTHINAGDWYANVFTAAHATGELRGTAPTLTQ